MPLDYIRPWAKIKVPGRRRAPSGAARTAGLLALWGLSLLGACAVGPRLEPVGVPASPNVTVTGSDVRLTVSPNTWAAYPEDLSQHFTPMEVRIENARDEDVVIRLEDFAALDDGRQQYRALPPGEVARAVTGGADRGDALLLAGPWYPYRPWRWAPYYGPYYGWGYWDPYYPYYWPYYWARPFPRAVLTLAVREGPIIPGASIQGFLYFQRATARGNSLTVSWTPHLVDGTALPTLSTEFRIVR